MIVFICFVVDKAVPLLQVVDVFCCSLMIMLIHVNAFIIRTKNIRAIGSFKQICFVVGWDWVIVGNDKC
jgi:hypothetical protein